MYECASRGSFVLLFLSVLLFVNRYCANPSFKVEVDTADHEDHTFSGVMFTIEAKSDLPVDFIQVNSVSVRGGEIGTMQWRQQTRAEQAY